VIGGHAVEAEQDARHQEIAQANLGRSAIVGDRLERVDEVIGHRSTEASAISSLPEKWR
jgi:hypothetical protein